MISTQCVDNIVDKPLLTSRQPSIEAGSDKLPIRQAKYIDK